MEDLVNMLEITLMQHTGGARLGKFRWKRERSKSDMIDRFSIEQLDGWWYLLLPTLYSCDSGCHLAFLTSRNYSAITSYSFLGQMSLLYIQNAQNAPGSPHSVLVFKYEPTPSSEPVCIGKYQWLTPLRVPPSP